MKGSKKNNPKLTQIIAPSPVLRGRQAVPAHTGRLAATLLISLQAIQNQSSLTLLIWGGLWKRGDDGSRTCGPSGNRWMSHRTPWSCARHISIATSRLLRIGGCLLMKRTTAVLIVLVQCFLWSTISTGLAIGAPVYAVSINKIDSFNVTGATIIGISEPHFPESKY